MDNVRFRYGDEAERYERREFDRGRDWGRANRGGWNMNRASWQSGGPYAGRGPRGYQRSDERIREDVNEILWEHDQINASDIDVRVQNGELTLEGTVDSRWTKRLAEDVAHEARGVHDVHNRLRVRRNDRASWTTPAMTGSRDRPTPRRATAGSVEMGGGRFGSGLNVAPEMAVVGSDGDDVGTVKQTRDGDFLVDCPMARDVYIQSTAIEASDDSTIRLNVTAGEVDNTGWQQPPITGTDTDDEQRVDMA
jgi:hypothetical protein